MCYVAQKVWRVAGVVLILLGMLALLFALWPRTVTCFGQACHQAALGQTIAVLVGGLASALIGVALFVFGLISARKRVVC